MGTIARSFNPTRRKSHLLPDGCIDPVAEFFRFAPDLPGTQPVGLRPRSGASAFLSGRHADRHLLLHPNSATGAQLGHSEGQSVPGWFDEAIRTIDALRHERYSPQPQTATATILSSETAREIYYRVRPLLSATLRERLQRVFLRDWEKLPFPKWPVDISVEQLLEKLLVESMHRNRIERVPFIWFWPDGAQAASIITHDVETDAGLAFVPRLMSINESVGAKASFQFVPEGRYDVPRSLIEHIRTNCCEVNVHDLDHNGNLFGDRKTFLRKARKINRYLKTYQAEGFRAGCMYRNTEWYDKLEAAYDMSVPNVAHLEPQRGGCCTVFPYFIGEVLELPLTTIQDYSLFNILGNYSIDVWRTQIELIMQKHGLISFIIHPDYVMNTRALRVYKSLLKHLSHLWQENDVWLARPGDVNRWWRERNAMELVRQGGKWHILGVGRQRARIAFASIRNDQIVYEVMQDNEVPTDPPRVRYA